MMNDLFPLNIFKMLLLTYKLIGLFCWRLYQRLLKLGICSNLIIIIDISLFYINYTYIFKTHYKSFS
jgi:hypothetical protein